MSDKKLEEITKDFAAVINRHSLENGSNTPDFILAEYLVSCLIAFNRAQMTRGKWYGHIDTPGTRTRTAPPPEA